MKSRRLLSALSALLIAALACNMPASGTPTSAPAATEPPAAGNIDPLAAISGLVWHDLCAVPDGPLPNPLPAGCNATGDGGAIANGVLEAGEPGIAGISVDLHSGSCTDPVIKSALTDASGIYIFDKLSAGNYCVSVDAGNATNLAILIPGGWTSPVSTGAVASISTTLQTNNDSHSNQNFGWDYQFLPAFNANPQTIATNTPAPQNNSGLPTFVVDTPANCRKGPSTAFEVLTSFQANTSVPIEGKNSNSTWWFVGASSSVKCWISGSTGHTTGDLSGVPFATEPPTPIAPTATPTKPAASGDTTPPVLSGAINLYSAMNYPTANCGPNLFNVAIRAADDNLDNVWVSFRFVSDSGNAGGWSELYPNDNAAGGLFGFNYDLNTEADLELGGDDGKIEYKFYAEDKAGNSTGYPDGGTLNIPLQYCP